MAFQIEKIESLTDSVVTELFPPSDLLEFVKISSDHALSFVTQVLQILSNNNLHPVIKIEDLRKSSLLKANSDLDGWPFIFRLAKEENTFAEVLVRVFSLDESFELLSAFQEENQKERNYGS